MLQNPITTTSTTSIVSPLRDKLVVELTQAAQKRHAAGDTKHDTFNLTAYIHGGDWTANDLYFNGNIGGDKWNLKIRDAALEALADFAAGSVHGKPDFFLVIPDEKAQGCGLSTLGYMFSDCAAGTVIDAGNGVTFTAPAIKFNRNGVVRLSQDGMGGFFMGDNAFVHPDSVNPKTGWFEGWAYYYALAMRRLLAGQNVSVLLNAISIDDAHKAVAIAQSDDPVAAKWGRKSENRLAAQVNREVRQLGQQEDLIEAVTGVVEIVTQEQLFAQAVSKSTKQVTVIDLLTWTGGIDFGTIDALQIGKKFWTKKGEDLLNEKRNFARTLVSSNLYALVP